MKTNDLRNIMTTAWRFFRITGESFSTCLRKVAYGGTGKTSVSCESFSTCLRKAWVNFKLVAAMRARIVKFYFQKVDGSIREAYGTLRPDAIPAQKGDNRRRNDTVQTYFDTEKREYRSFKKLNLVSIQ